MTEEYSAIIGFRQRDEPKLYIDGIDGSTLWPCHFCKEPTWLAPSSVKTMANHPNHRVVCLPCIVPDLQAGAPLTAAQDDGSLVSIAEALEHPSEELLSAFRRTQEDDPIKV